MEQVNMSRRVTKADLEAENKALRRERDVLSHALNAVMRYNAIGLEFTPACIETLPVDNDEYYDVRVHDLMAAHGGVVIVTYFDTGRKPYTQAHYLDDWAPKMRATAAAARVGEYGRVNAALRDIADKFCRMRQALCINEADAKATL